MNFDGKEDAVINALKLTLQPVEPLAINITSYTVGAPVCVVTRVGTLKKWLCICQLACSTLRLKNIIFRL